MQSRYSSGYHCASLVHCCPFSSSRYPINPASSIKINPSEVRFDTYCEFENISRPFHEDFGRSENTKNKNKEGKTKLDRLILIICQCPDH